MLLLETERLAFRHHLPEDLEPYCEMESDAFYRRPFPVCARPELERNFWQAEFPAKPMGLLATILKVENRYIGRCGLYPFRDGPNDEVVSGEASLAYYLARPFWGRGLATEAGRGFIRYGFEVLKLTRIHAGMNAENIGSMTVAEKIGMRYVRSGEGGGSKWHHYELCNPRL